MNIVPNTIEGEVIETVAEAPDALGWLQHRGAKRYDDMTDLGDFLRERSAKARTSTIANRQIELLSHPEPQSRDDMNQLLVSVDGNVTGMTHWSFGQLAGLAKAPAAYLRTLPAALVKDNIEFSLRINREVEEVKAYYDGTELRAITGPSYGRVDDYEVVDAVQSILDTGRWKPAEKHMGLSVTDRSLQMFLIDENNPIEVGRARNVGDIMYRGLRISNSELGYSSLRVEAFLFRLACLNGMVMPMAEGDIMVRHSKNAPYRWAREVQPAVERYAAQDGAKLIEQVEAVKSEIVARSDEDAVNWLRKRGLNAAQSKLAIKRIEQEENTRARSAWDMIQGITSIARDIGTAEDRADMEKLAGSIWTKVAA